MGQENETGSPEASGAAAAATNGAGETGTGGTGDGAAAGGTEDGAAAEAAYARELAALFTEQAKDTLTGRMGIEIVAATARRAVATMPVKGNTQPYGLLHGGASCVLAESLGSLAAALHAGPDRITVGIEINATHHRAVSSGVVTAVATMVHGGSTLATYEIEITDERKRRVCTARLSCLLRDANPRMGLALGPAGVSPAPGPDV